MDIHELLGWIGVGLAGVLAYMSHRSIFKAQNKKD